MSNRFSIITPTFNSRKFLSDCYTSVQSQKDVTLEHLFIDGLSSDGTVELLKDLSVHFISEKDKGVYEALNKGMKLASGDFIGILHSDDLFGHDLILKQILEKFQEGADVVYGDLTYIDRNDSTKIFRKWKSYYFYPLDLEFGWMPPHPTVFFRKNLLSEIGYYDESFRISGDYGFLLRLFRKNLKIAYLPEVVTKMRVGGISNRSFRNIVLKMREDFQIASKNFSNPYGTLVGKNLRKLKQFL